MAGALAIAGTILFTVYGQLVVKWQVSEAGDVPSGTGDRVSYFLAFLTNPWMISVWLFIGVAAVCWIYALSKFELSRAYPFMSASFVLVLIASVLLLGETLTATKVAGLALIVAGLVVGSQG